MQKTPDELLESNLRWSRTRVAADPDYFLRLSRLQTPDFLWIGCSDSRVPANVITGLEPGEVFVHRNVANIVYPADLNCMSVLQFAVETLQVKHIIVCGHYGCGGVHAALGGSQHRLIEHWLAPVRDLFHRHSQELSSLPTDEARVDRVCELNVLTQVRSVCDSPIVRSAWDRGQPLAVHGWIYRLSDGRLRDLKCTRAMGAYRGAD
ncbi:MAG: carbonate dehydratase [Bradyrhizobiaceae bacterium]|nr:carbonate dehydratase [Bradyrhizobiaceae bacterium]